LSGHFYTPVSLLPQELGYPLDRRLSGPHSQSVHAGKEKYPYRESNQDCSTRNYSLYDCGVPVVVNRITCQNNEKDVKRVRKRELSLHKVTVAIIPRDSVSKQDVKEARVTRACLRHGISIVLGSTTSAISYRCIRNAAHNSFRIPAFQQNIIEQNPEPATAHTGLARLNSFILLWPIRESR
jgi:hypothetical protein